MAGRSLVETTQVLRRNCILKPTTTENVELILKPGVNDIGRNRETKIKDVRCSKYQLSLDVDMKQCSIRMKVLGINPCGVNGFMAQRGYQCELEHGDIIEVVYGRHQFEVVFRPPPPSPDSQKIYNRPVSEVTAMDISIERESSNENCWELVDDGRLAVYTGHDVMDSDKIAAYDLDGTIIKTKSGKVFPKNYDDWQIIYPEVTAKLKCLKNNKFKICIFTNQAGISRGKTDLNLFKKKIEAIISKLDVPVQVFIAVGDGYYRKPIPGMWNYLQTNKNNNIKIRKDKSFFVGDAAGRPERGTGLMKRKKDHSSADRLFAINVGLCFHTPEEHFLGQKPLDWVKPEFNPTTNVDSLPLFDPEKIVIPSSDCEVIVLVGLPGSGKSHFARTHLEPLGYSILSADILRSTQACLSKCEKLLESKSSCVLDNTNVDIESRKKIINLARRYSIPCRCFMMSTSLAQIKHNIAFRQLTDKKHSTINEMVLNAMKKKFKEPSVDEGFNEIVKVNFKPQFADAEQEQLYKLYLIDK